MKPIQILVLNLLGFLLFSISSANGQVNWKRLSSVTGEIQIPNEGAQQTCCVVCDLDNDGKDDFIVGERTATPSVVWYRYNGEKFERHIIDDNHLTSEAGGDACDIDQDGDIDIILGQNAKGNSIWWWENPYPNFDKPWQRRYVKISGDMKHHDQSFADYDGDGQIELAAWNQNGRKLLLFEIPQDPKTAEFWESSVIYTWGKQVMLEGFARNPVDIDQDGLIDIVGGGRWFKYKGGKDFEAHVIDERRCTQCAAGQLIKGGRPEILFSPADIDGNAIWYEWKNSKWIQHNLRFVIHGHTCDIRDVNKDGNLDIFIGEMGQPGNGANARTFIWYGDGNGNFIESIVYQGQGIHEGLLGDFNGDDYPDILVKPYKHRSPCIEVLINGGTEKLPLEKWEKHHIADLPNKSVFIDAGDISGDGWPDLIAGGWWWENPGYHKGKWMQNTIGEPLNNMASVYDFDADGDLDILGTRGVGNQANHQFILAENNGQATFKIHPVSDPGGKGDFLQGCLATNFGNTRMVMLSWHNKGGGGTQVLDVPDEPAKDQWGNRLLTSFSQNEDLDEGDIDRDGDTDILTGTYWLQNNNGTWIPIKIGDIPEGVPDRNELADINLDGRLDAVISLELSKDLFWFEAPEDPIQPWSRHLIGTINGMGFSMDIGDFDNDGDPDMVVGEHRGKEENRIIIFENQNKGMNWVEHVIDSAPVKEIDHHDGTQVVDIDYDGDLDIISIGWHNPKVWLYENKAID